MTLTTVLAIGGWALFVTMSLLYWFGNKINNHETNALAVFSLAALLSDDFRSATRSGFDKAIQEGHSAGIDPKDLTFRLMQGVTQNAKNLYNKEDAPINTIDVVLNAIKKPIRSNHNENH